MVAFGQWQWLLLPQTLYVPATVLSRHNQKIAVLLQRSFLRPSWSISVLSLMGQFTSDIFLAPCMEEEHGTVHKECMHVSLALWLWPVPDSVIVLAICLHALDFLYASQGDDLLGLHFMMTQLVQNAAIYLIVSGLCLFNPFCCNCTCFWLVSRLNTIIYRIHPTFLPSWNSGQCKEGSQESFFHAGTD